MKTSHHAKRPLIVGIFVSLGILILVVTIFAMGSIKKTFVRSFTVDAVFNDVSGLVEGDNVWLSGVKIGTVKRIVFSNHGKVLVTLSIENQAGTQIHTGAIAKIGSDGLIGNKLVVLSAGNIQSGLIKPAAILASEASVNTDDLLATLQDNNKNILKITGSLIRIVAKADTGSGAAAMLLNDRKLPRKISSALMKADAAAGSIQTASAKSVVVLNHLSAFSSRFSHTGYLLNDLSADTAIYRKMKGIVASAQNTTDSLATVVASLSAAGRKLQQRDNTAGLLLNDSSSAKSIEETIKNLEKSSYDLDENLKALQHNFLFRGYFRKKERQEKN